MALYLEPCNGGRQIVFDKAVILIGRQSDCDIVLEKSQKVSRKHCCIAQVNHQYLIRDLSSMNGVRVNGKRIKREAVLELGAEVAIGDVKFVLKDSNAAAAPPPTPPPVPKPRVKRPVDISQQFAIPIDEDSDGLDFAVENSDEGKRPPESDQPAEPLIFSEPAAPEILPSEVAFELDDSDDAIPPVN